jgi:hypothetical protein
MRMIGRSTPLFALCLLAGCADDRAGYPTLAPRPIEKLGFGEPEATIPVAVADPALDAEIGKAAARVTQIGGGFDRDAAIATRATAAARGSPVGSEAWLTAQTALAGLDDWRAQASAAVSDIEQLATDRAAALQPAYPALEALQARARVEADREGATIRRLQDQLPAA